MMAFGQKSQYELATRIHRFGVLSYNRSWLFGYETNTNQRIWLSLVIRYLESFRRFDDFNGTDRWQVHEGWFHALLILG